MTLPTSQAFAYVDGRLASGFVEVRHDLAALDEPGFWVVVVSFEGNVTCARFADVTQGPLPAARWSGPRHTEWTTSLGHAGYVAGVEIIRGLIEQGAVYQVNLCRVLSARSAAADLSGLATALAAEHPSRYPALVCLPEVGVHVCSASPELFLSRARVDGADVLATRPIKGTGRTAAELSEKDRAENIMIVDMARNDLSRVAWTGGVDVPTLLELEEYPGLVHLVSTVRATLVPGVTWPQIFAATFPPASVSGAPKSSALRIISQLEPVPRGPYCGAIGWVDADRQTASLAVAIRTFWLDDGQLRFGTGAGITWGSDPQAEWAETELKAELLVGLASRA
ncbi:MAG TPA: anthranilate synthase component I family protein [Acidothermaceae bacterium]|nr:anthranilate synthase component I family protein [Acidothermaceae bacterium]